MTEITSAAVALATLANGGDYFMLKKSGVVADLTTPEHAQKILDLAKTALATDATEELAKTVTISTGLTAYQLRAPSLLFNPVITPIRNSLKRTALAMPGDAAHWKAINALNNNPQNMGWVPEGRRAASITYSASPQSASYASMGTEDSITDEAKFAAVGFEDEEALIQMRSLYKLMTIEESSLLFGNNSLALGTPGAPTLAAAGSGATLPAATYSVIVVALTAQGMANASLANGVLTPQTINSNDGNGSFTINGGSSNKSANATQAVTLGQTLSCIVAPVVGAAGYAWYVGTAGSEKLEAITSINSATFSAPLAGTHQAATAITGDWSENSIAYDGLVTQTFKNIGNGAYVNTLATGTAGAGTQLTAVGDGEVAEIRAMLRSMWDNYRVTITRLYVSSQELQSITKLVLSGGSAPLLRINETANDGPANVRFTAGAVVGWYFNPYTADGGRFIPIILHPNMPAGTIFGYAEVLPATYMSNETPTVAELLVRQDYYVEKWPRTSRSQFYGTYCQSVPAIYAPFCFGVINNIAPTV